jgi:hypothetical protein
MKALVRFNGSTYLGEVTSARKVNGTDRVTVMFNTTKMDRPRVAELKLLDMSNAFFRGSVPYEIAVTCHAKRVRYSWDRGAVVHDGYATPVAYPANISDEDLAANLAHDSGLNLEWGAK